MELEHVKQVFIKEGEVKRILKGDIVLWKKPEVGIQIKKNSTEPVTEFVAGKYFDMTFPVEYDKAIGTPTWSISGLPEGLSYTVTNEGLKISGYAEGTGTYNVTVTVTLGEYSDSQIYTFIIESDGNKIEITNSSLGNWNIGLAGSATLTSSVTGNIEGSKEYRYSSSLPSWMSLNPTTGVLSGTPDESAYSAGYVYVYAIMGAYRSPLKVLRYDTVRVKPTPKYTASIIIDCTALCVSKSSSYKSEYELNLQELFESTATPLSSYTFSITELTNNDSNILKQITRRLYISVIKNSSGTKLWIYTSTNPSYAGSNLLMGYFTLTASNSYGTVQIPCALRVVQYSTYKSSPSSYSAPFWFAS